MKKLEELGISKAPWGTYQTKKEVAVTTSVEGFGDLESALCRGPRRKSNARLIKAAPKLYECLSEAVEDKCHFCVADEDERRELCDQCIVADWKDALAEAAGESEVQE